MFLHGTDDNGDALKVKGWICAKPDKHTLATESTEEHGNISCKAFIFS